MHEAREAREGSDEIGRDIIERTRERNRGREREREREGARVSMHAVLSQARLRESNRIVRIKNLGTTSVPLRVLTVYRINRRKSSIILAAREYPVGIIGRRYRAARRYQIRCVFGQFTLRA